MNFVEEFIQGLNKQVSIVQARSQELMQAYNLSTLVRELERKKTAKLLEIGRLVYDKYDRHTELSEETLKELVGEAAAFEREITATQAEIDSMKMQNDPTTPASKRADAQAGFKPTPGFECPRCQAPASREKAFCPACGEPLKPSSTSGEDTIDVG